MMQSNTSHKYLILDSRGTPLAQGEMEGRTSKKIWPIFIRNDEAMKRVLSHEYVKLISSTDGMTIEGKILSRDGDEVYIEPQMVVGEAPRENLRMPVRFQSYLYPVSGPWKGRVPILSNDLSCGGIAFFCPRSLKVGEVAEIVIPITEQPLILEIQIVRERPSPEHIPMYAAEFIDLVHDQESMLREAVFNLQLDGSICGTNGKG